MLNGIKFFIKNFEELISGFFLSLMVSIVIMNVILRYAFNKGIFWAEEVATISFVWAVFVGASATYKHRMDVGIDFLVTKTPLTMQSIIKLVIDFLLLIINGYIFYLSIVFTKISAIKPTAVLGISSAFVNSALVVGFGLITFHTLRFIVIDFKSIKNPALTEETSG